MSTRKMAIRLDAVHPAMSILRSRYWTERLVYVLRADKNTGYKKGRSRIVYIGETRRDNRRPASSAARVARAAFGILPGVRQIDVHPLTFRGKQSVRMWEALEHDLLAMFKHMHGEVPRYNIQGKGKRFAVDEIKLFRKKRLESIIKSLS
jgi:hypothetical protein